MIYLIGDHMRLGAAHGEAWCVAAAVSAYVDDNSRLPCDHRFDSWHKRLFVEAKQLSIVAWEIPLCGARRPWNRPLMTQPPARNSSAVATTGYRI